MDVNLEIYLYHFSKRENSTKRPDGNGRQMVVVWNQPFDVVNPTIRVKNAEISNYNFAYIPVFGRYYWLNTFSRMRNADEIEVECKCDVLATYRPNLLPQSFYIEYSQSNYNALYNDSRIAVMATLNRVENAVEMAGISTNSCSQYYLEAVGTGSNGTFTNKYIVLPANVGLIAEKALTDPEVIKGVYEGFVGLMVQEDTGNWVDGLKNGMMSYVLQSALEMGSENGLNADDLKTVIGNVSGKLADWWSDVWSIVQERWKNPWDCIVKIQGLAISSTQIFDMSGITNVMLGVTDCQVAARMLQNTLSQELTTTVAIPWQYSDFRNLEPYTQVSITLPNCSCVKLPADLLYGSTSIVARYRINATTGDVAGYLETNGGFKFADFSFNIATPISVGYANDRAMGGLGYVFNAGQIAAGVATGNIEMGATGVQGLLTPKKYTASMHGTTQTCALMDNMLRVEVAANNTENPNNLLSMGRPCRQVLPLSSLSGYVKCANASADLPATYPELQEVNAYLNGGFYVE